MHKRGKPIPFLVTVADRYFERPIRWDLSIGLLVAIIGWFVQRYLRNNYTLVLTKESLTSFADQLCSASISMAGFVFTALALLISVGENYRAKYQETHSKGSTTHTSEEYYPADGFEAFFVTNLYVIVVKAFLWASIELFATFAGLALLKFLWSILPDWSCKVSLIISFVLLAGPIARAVYMVNKVLTMRKPIATSKQQM